MSSIETESRMQDTVETKSGVKCRIPQRLPNRTKTSLTRPKAQNNDNVPLRPKSANRIKDDMASRQIHSVIPRALRPERDRPPIKRPSTIPKRVANEVVGNKNRQIIMVPVAAKAHGKNICYKTITGLPDQETIKKCEELEVRQSEYATCGYGDDQESITSVSDKAMQLKIKWEDKMVQFEKLKTELVERQRDLLEVYASLRAIHHKMSLTGQKALLPPAEDLRIMNVSNLTPGQLLQLCANSEGSKVVQDIQRSAQVPMSIDVNKLYNMPSRLVATCEQTLIKRKEIIDWFDSLKKQEKGISMGKLSKKLNEFNAENDMLNCNLDQIKTEIYSELNEMVDAIRKGVNETIAMQLRVEDLMYTMSELNAKNDDLRKQLQNADHLKSQSNRYRIEELEKELKEEKCKKMMMRERLSRAEGQVKINVDRAAQLEATLEQSRTQNRTLERTVQHLHEQNQKLQTEFDKEINKLTESIKENTAHLEEIADAREKLEAEKEQLEKRIEDLSAYYNESLENLKSEMNTNVVKLIETNERYQLEVCEKKKLEDKISSLCSQLLESELKLKDMQKPLQDNEELTCKLNICEKELETAQCELHIARHEIDDYKNKLLKDDERILDLEQQCKESQDLLENIKCDLKLKEQIIKELDREKLQLQREMQDSNSKMSSYEEQLTSLRNQLNRLQEDFGEVENINELCEMVSQQKEKLQDVTRQNRELIELLQNKDLEIERQTESILLLEEKNEMIKMKDTEQANIIKLLRNNLEMRTKADSELQQQLAEKNTEIDKLITSLETRKQQITEFEKIIITLEEQTHKANIQISQLETIILTLEDQSKKDSLQKREDHEKIALLENKIQEYESYYIENKRQQEETSSDNLDNLIKILEDELGMPLEKHSNLQDKEYARQKKYSSDRKKVDKRERNDGEPPIYSESESMPAKTVMENYGKHGHYLYPNEENFDGDNLDRKKASTNMDMQKMVTPEIGMNVYGTSPTNKDYKSFKSIAPVLPPKKNMVPRNLGLFSPDKLQDDKKYKMYKFAGHRL